MADSKNNVPRVYYGQYTLEYWIELMIQKNIVCPAYQRKFVWDVQGVEMFIDSLKNDLFIPPVTIGLHKRNGARSVPMENENFIIDGQQRLSSILLAYCGVFPKNGSSTDSEEEVKGLDWQFQQLIELGSTKEEIHDKAIASGDYSELRLPDFNADGSFFKNHYLGYSYIVPYEDDKIKQQKYYSELFRNMNTLGTPLTKLQSRLALYYINETIVPWFNPSFTVKIKNQSTPANSSLDFVRYTSILTGFIAQQEQYPLLLKGYGQSKEQKKNKKTLEDYFVKYVEFIVYKQAKSDLFGDWDNNLEHNYKERISNLEQEIERLGLQTIQFKSIVEIDVYFFGLIYYVVFKERRLDPDKIATLHEDLQNKIRIIKNDSNYAKHAGSVGKIKARMKTSLRIYKKALFK